MTNVRASDRSWNDPGGKLDSFAATSKPQMHAVVFDLSTISHIDTAGMQSLIDTRNQVERWADRPVEFHFTNIYSP